MKARQCRFLVLLGQPASAPEENGQCCCFQLLAALPCFSSTCPTLAWGDPSSPPFTSVHPMRSLRGANPFSSFLQPAHRPGLCWCGATGEASRHGGMRLACARIACGPASSSSCQQQRRADVPIGDLSVSVGAVPPECWNAGPRVPVSETPEHAPFKGMVLHFIMAIVDLPAVVLRRWHQRCEFPSSLDVVFQCCWNKAAGVAFNIQALASTTSSSGSHKTTALDQDAASL